MSNSALFALLLAAGALAPGAALGQGAMELAMARPQPHFVAAWAPKKEREAERSAVLAGRVSLDLRDVSLDAALKALTNQAGLRITYSRAVLPVGKRVTISASDIAVVTAMTEMLFRSGLDVVVDRDGALALVMCRHSVGRPEVEAKDTGVIAGAVTDKATGAPLVGAVVTVEGTLWNGTTAADGRYRIAGVEVGKYAVRARYVGYAPVTMSVTVTAAEVAALDFGLEKAVQLLEELVTTGTVVPTELKAVPSPVSIVTAEQIEAEGLRRIDQVFRGGVPGAIAWDLGTNDYTTTVQARGRSSLAVAPTIKTYIDGVEMADPQYIATIDPRSIERIEITRGPQGSTVYGSEASAGVMQVFTKKGRAGQRPEVSGSAALGSIEGPYRDGMALRQDYSLAVSGSSENATYRIGGSYVRMGEWAPEYYSRTPSLSGTASLTQGSLSAQLSTRYSAQTRSHVYSPALSSLTFFSRPAFETDQLKQQTYGLNLSYRATPNWEHNLILGFDETSFDFQNTEPRRTTPADTFLQVFTQEDSKPSIRYNTSYRLTGGSWSTTLTGGLEYFEAFFHQDYTGDATTTSGTIDGNHFVSRASFSNTGYFGQVQVGVSDALFLTAGLRGERNQNFGDRYGTAWSPRVGVAYARPAAGPLAFKLRASYGNAIRGAESYHKQAVRTASGNQLANPNLGPERQEGWDAGVELYLGSRASLAVTYYDQTAKDLIDAVFLNTMASVPEAQFQNVGEVENSGWEFQGKIAFGKLDVLGTYSRTRSTVERLSPTYSGDLRVGDQVLEVPRHTAGASVIYSPFSGTRLVTRMTHIGGWTGTDFMTLFGVFYGTEPFRGSVRDYWIEYPSVTKFNASLTQGLTPRLTGFLHIDNVGNNTRFEQSNVMIPLGRLTTVGMQLTY